MQLWQYTGVIRKTLIMQGKTTFTDKRSAMGSIFLPLDSECTTGHVLGESHKEATTNATQEIKQRYPEEKGYKIESICLETCQEVTV